MFLKAYAKVNIGLRVGDKKGKYHGIETYMCLVDLFDSIEAEIEESNNTSVSISNNGYLVSGPDIMERAAFRFSEYYSVGFTARISIEKRIPIASGLGGGSSDAATVLNALGEFFGMEIKPDLSLSVGSDVPFFVSGFKAAKVTGFGDVVEEVSGPSGKVLIVPSEKGIITESAYDALDGIERETGRLPVIGQVPLTRENFPNDFEALLPGDFFPEIGGDVFYSLTGSGSAWYIIPAGDEYDAGGIIHSEFLE